LTESLQSLLARRIALDGPMGLAEFMALALGHPQYGYYNRRDPLGVGGDFTTAPEISQMFGELIGAWIADLWLQLGQPDPVILVELGPGRGTLMADALRATQRLPGFHAALRLHLVETSPALRQRQAACLAGYRPGWHDQLDTVSQQGPLLLLANEFFDALPIRQFIRTDRGWAERKVGLDSDGGLTWVLDPRPGAALLPAAIRTAVEVARPGSVVEICPAGTGIAAQIGERLAVSGGAALIIDYGYRGPAVGDTLQAVRAHRYVPVLADPGESDLTAHVDFTALATAAQAAGARHLGPVGQGDFLTALGLPARAAALKRLASERQAADIDSAAARLCGDQAMGRLFQVMALTGPGPLRPAGFVVESQDGADDGRI
jgi:NADH dehydrogenase [ubiquinone] 1 alpha subcomplex assembly factor 7